MVIGEWLLENGYWVFEKWLKANNINFHGFF